MAEPPVKGKGSGLGKKIGPLPLWAWTLIALAVGYFLWTRLRGSSAAAGTTAPVQSASGGTTAAPSPADTGSGAGAGAGGSGAGGADLSGTVAAQSQSLSDVATTAENQLGYLASSTTVGAFQLANTALLSNTQLANQALLNAGQPTVIFAQPANTTGLSKAPAGTPPAYAQTPTIPNYGPPITQAQSEAYVQGTAGGYSNLGHLGSPYVSPMPQPVTAYSSSGAGAVASGSTKVNYQARVRAV